MSDPSVQDDKTSEQDLQNAPSASDERGADGREAAQRKNWLERTVSGAGAVVVAFVVGFLVYQLGWGTDEPANLVVELGTPSPSGETLLVPVTVRNTGDRVAAAAVIAVCAGPDTCAQLTFDYIPFASTQHGSVGFKAPLTGPLETRVVSYRDP